MEIAPKFYHRPDNGLPSGWIQMIRQSIRRLAPEFSTGRMVQEYAEKFYVPASNAFDTMRSGNLEKAKEAFAWRQQIRGAWGEVRILQSSDSAGTALSLGKPFNITAMVNLGSLPPESVKVQAILGKIGPNRELVDYRVYDLACVGQEGSAYKFDGQVQTHGPGHRGYTVRVIPNHPDVSIPTELNLIRWQAS
jgi:starch phosphorylase